MANQTLGDLIRDGRVRKGLSLRALAAQIGKTPSYLSDIENDRRVPAEDVLRDLSSALDLSFDELMAHAGRVGERAERYLRREPAAGRLFRTISEANLRPEEVELLLVQAEELAKKREQGR